MIKLILKTKIRRFDKYYYYQHTKFKNKQRKSNTSNKNKKKSKKLTRVNWKKKLIKVHESIGKQEKGKTFTKTN